MKFQLNRRILSDPVSRDPPILAVAISPDGEFALSSGLDFTLRRWEVQPGECTHTWQAGGPLYAITIIPGGEKALISTVMGAMLWDVKGWQFVRSFFTHYGGTYDIGYAQGLNMVVGAGEDSQIYRWDFETEEKYQPLRGHRTPVTALAMSDDSNLLISGDSSGEVRCWDVKSGECLLTWQGHESKISDIQLLSRSEQAVTVSQGEPVKHWYIKNGKLLLKYPNPQHWIETLAVSKQGNWMLSAGEGGLQVWDLSNQMKILEVDSPGITSLVLSPDNTFAVTGGQDGSLVVWFIKH